MKNALVLLILGLLLVSTLSFVIAEQGNANRNQNQGGQDDDNSQTGQDNSEDNDNEDKCPNNDCIQERDRGRVRDLTKEQIRKVIQERNRLNFENKTGEKCPDNCTCQGVVARCDLGNGTRQMTVYAQSGNKIIITKGINASTTVELYKSGDNETLVGVFKGNKTKQIKMTPEQVQQKIEEKIQRKIEAGKIILDEDGYYKVKAMKKVKLFGFLKVRERVNWEIDPETGKIIRTRTSWWGFLATENKSEEPPLIGASCGTVTPGMNDKCCQNKGYDYWNSTSLECMFNAVE